MIQKKEYNYAYFGGGCFWCIEAVFQDLNGVFKVTSGYAGGNKETANYKDVSSGNTQHVEVCKITYNPDIIDYKTLLKYFFEAHDPTTLNRQGNDIGSQYRSAIFFANENQKELANEFKERIDTSKVFKNPIVTEIKPLGVFYEAENYHKNYYNNNKEQPYCKLIIRPKLDKIFKNTTK